MRPPPLLVPTVLVILEIAAARALGAQWVGPCPPPTHKQEHSPAAGGSLLGTPHCPVPSGAGGTGPVGRSALLSLGERCTCSLGRVSLSPSARHFERPLPAPPSRGLAEVDPVHWRRRGQGCGS